MYFSFCEWGGSPDGKNAFGLSGDSHSLSARVPLRLALRCVPGWPEGAISKEFARPGLVNPVSRFSRQPLCGVVGTCYIARDPFVILRDFAVDWLGLTTKKRRRKETEG